jgi:hypothetical protein
MRAEVLAARLKEGAGAADAKSQATSTLPPPSTPSPLGLLSSVLISPIVELSHREARSLGRTSPGRLHVRTSTRLSAASLASETSSINVVDAAELLLLPPLPPLLLLLLLAANGEAA